MILHAIIAQFPITLSIPHNLGMIEAVLEQAKTGDWVLFPEGSLSGYSTDGTFLKQIDQQQVAAGLRQIQETAKEQKINIWVGACICRDGQWFNTAQFFGADGNHQVYEKVNLANHERGVFATGSHLPVFEVSTPEGKVKVGAQICRELRFPEQWGWLARCGAQVIFHLNNAIGNDQFQPVWKSHLISRAAETQRFVLSANNAALKQVSPTIAIAPDGQILGEIVSAQPGILHTALDLAEVSNWYLDQSRADIIAITTHTTGS